MALDWADGRVTLSSVIVVDRTDGQRTARLAFDAGGRFSLATHGDGAAVSGAWVQDEAAARTTLLPDRPSWSAIRPVGIEAVGRAGRIVVRTRIG